MTVWCTSSSPTPLPASPSWSWDRAPSPTWPSCWAGCCPATTATSTATASPGHGADHLLPVLVSPSLSIPVEDGRPLLGTWQSVVLVDLNRDNPQRRVRLSFLPG